MATTSSKAVGGAVAANLTVIAVWLVSTIPGWDMVPMEPKAAILALVASAIRYGGVYISRANVEIPAPQQTSTLGLTSNAGN